MTRGDCSSLAMTWILFFFLILLPLLPPRRDGLIATRRLCIIVRTYVRLDSSTIFCYSSTPFFSFNIRYSIIKYRYCGCWLLSSDYNSIQLLSPATRSTIDLVHAPTPPKGWNVVHRLGEQRLLSHHARQPLKHFQIKIIPVSSYRVCIDPPSAHVRIFVPIVICAQRH